MGKFQLADVAYLATKTDRADRNVRSGIPVDGCRSDPYGILVALDDRRG